MDNYILTASLISFLALIATWLALPVSTEGVTRAPATFRRVTTA